MKKNINLYGAEWDLQTSENHCQTLKHIRWVYDGSSDTSVYVNSSIEQALDSNDDTIKYAWLNESKAIDAQSYQVLNRNINRFVEVFEKIFTHDKSIYSNYDNAVFVPLSVVWIKDMAVHPKDKIVSMISSSKNMCRGHEIRLSWVERLSDKLDLYGSGFRHIKNKETGLKDYMFSVAIENDTYGSCFTEKILDCFATGTVPVYLGPKDIGNFFNIDGIIELNDDFDILSLNKDLYMSKMDAIKENFELCKEYIHVEDYMYEKYLAGE